MRRKLYILLLAFLLIVSSAMADAYILHKPRKGQLTEKQAVAAASSFLAARFDLPEDAFVPYYERSGNRCFGPGWQWHAMTDEDCWCVSFPYTGTLPVSGAILTLHGVTGEVLYWSYRASADQTTYTMALPGDEQLSLSGVRQLIADRLAAETKVKLTEGAADTMTVSASFGPEIVTPWDSLQPKYPEATGPIWSVVAWYPAEGPDCQYIVFADIDAANGTILSWDLNDK